MKLQEQLRKSALAQGWDYFGVADLSAHHDYMASFCGDFIREYPRAVSLVIRIADGVVDPVESQEQDKVLSFHNYIYYAVDYLQNTGTVRLAHMIERAGWRAFPVPASYNVYPKRLAGLVSHKLTGRLAGLGWIGKSGLFLTPEDGPRVRLATILTDAPLSAGKAMESPLRHLQPLHKDLSGRGHPRTGRSRKTNPTRCASIHSSARRSSKTGKRNGGISIERCVCGVCVAVCPFGKTARQAEKRTGNCPSLPEEASPPNR